MINPELASLSIRRQCELLSFNRSTLYYKTKEQNVDDVELLNMIRDIWVRRSFYGYRRNHTRVEG